MIDIRENVIDVNTYLMLRASVNWKELSREQADKALNNSMYTVCAYVDDIPVGMGRIVGDGAVVCYIQDLIVIPTCQSMHIGNALLGKLIEYVDSIKIADSEIMLCLMCAKGREEFYKKYGFISRPTDNLGPGMIQYIR